MCQHNMYTCKYFICAYTAIIMRKNMDGARRVVDERGDEEGEAVVVRVREPAAQERRSAPRRAGERPRHVGDFCCETP